MAKAKRTARPGGAPLKPARSGKSRKRAAPRSTAATRQARPRTAKPQAARPRKAKPPCKYGPRLANGRCPTKPRASFAERVAGKSAGVRLTSRSKKSITTRALERLESQASSQIAGAVGVRALRKQLPKAKTATSSYIARQAEIATGAAASKSVAANLVKLARAPVIPRVGKAAAGAVGVSAGASAALAIIAGAGSYFATKFVLAKLEERKDKKITAADVKFQAAMAYRRAREDAARQLGRPLTLDEHKVLAEAFKANLKKLGE